MFTCEGADQRHASYLIVLYGTSPFAERAMLSYAHWTVKFSRKTALPSAARSCLSWTLRAVTVTVRGTCVAFVLNMPIARCHRNAEPSVHMTASANKRTALATFARCGNRI